MAARGRGLFFLYIYIESLKTSSCQKPLDRFQYNLLEKYSVSLKTRLQQGISEPEFYGDLVYRFGKSNFSDQFRKLINRYKGIGYSLDIMRQTACLVANPIIVDGYASLFNCMTAVRASDVIRPLRKTLTSGLGLDDLSLA